MIEAKYASTPVVAVVGEIRSPRLGVHVFQEADHKALLSGVMKAVVEPRSEKDMAGAAVQAVHVAIDGRRGPTMLLVEEQVLWTEMPDSFTAWETLVATARHTVARNSSPRIHAALETASRAMIYAGSGALGSGAGGEISRLAARHDLPIAMSPLGKRVVSDEDAVGVASGYTSGRYGVGNVARRCRRRIRSRLDCDSRRGVAGNWDESSANRHRSDGVLAERVA